MDVRDKKLAELLVNYSTKIQKDEKVWIEWRGEHCRSLVTEIIKEITKKGGVPHLYNPDDLFMKAFLENTNEQQIIDLGQLHEGIMAQMDAYIGVTSQENMYELSTISQNTLQLMAKHYNNKVHHKRVLDTKWVILRYPNPGMAQKAEMSTDDFIDFIYDVSLIDYEAMDKNMEPLKQLMEKTDKVRITAPETDITFSIKDIPVIKCSGQMNIPDGELFTAPVKNSVNGYITYNAKTRNQGNVFDSIRLEVKDGKIINAKSTDAKSTDILNKVLDTDEGARYFGEFAIGVNPKIKKPMLEILFDEKIDGSIHLTPGRAYAEAFNGNESAVHWDLVLIQTPEYGGGELYFDDVLIRKDGKFVIDGINF